MATHIVTNERIVNIIKGSRYFRMNFGLVATVERSGRRGYNEKDKFAYFYSNRYNTIIYAKGNIGDIKFYVDQYIHEDVLAVYHKENFQEFIFDLDSDFIRQKGVDAYVGKVLMECDQKWEDLKEKKSLDVLVEKPKGDAQKVSTDPGNVSWEDVKAYLEAKKRGQL